MNSKSESKIKDNFKDNFKDKSKNKYKDYKSKQELYNNDGTYLLNNKDVELFLKNADQIVKNAQKMKIKLVEPYEEEIRQVNDVVIEYIKQNKRKIYGGYALNFLLINKDPKLAIYTDADTPDIDFYSPEPIKDLIKICNLLHSKGYKNVSGREALHKETYSIKVNNQLYCDITYVPRNIYNKMSFREINGINVIGPEFMVIDYFRLITDIILTNWRIEKTVKRMYLLQNAYPLPYIKSPIEIPPINDITNDDSNMIQNIMKRIQSFCENNNFAILVGIYAYDQFLHESNILQAPNEDRFKYLDIPYYEIILTEYRTEAKKLINDLKTKFNIENDIHVIEYYPFFQYLGHSAEIYYKKTLLARLYTNNKKCIPYKQVKSHYFSDDKIEHNSNSSNILIGSFSFTVMFALITAMKARVNDDKNTKNLYYAIISHITEFRNFYFKTTNSSLIDNTIFQEFVVECLGTPITPEHERQLLIENRKRKNKKYSFLYDPNENKIEDLNYVFANSSGNIISYTKNLKLGDDVAEQDEDDFDEDDPNIVLK